MYFDFCTIDWTAIGSIATAATLAFSLYQIKELKKQRNEDIRARLSFSFVAWNSLFLLKITNVGKENAYDIKLHFDGDLYENIYAKAIKERFEKLQKREFIIEAGRSEYYDISHIYTSNSTMMYGETKEQFDSDFINKWLKKHFNDKLNVSGTYCNGKYKIQEEMSLADYITGSIEYYDEATLALQKISKSLKEIRKSLSLNNDK